MSKVFTAQEMRHAEDSREAWGDNDEVNNMLRQAANAMEREKKYQYAVKCNGNTIYANCNGDAIYNITTNACRARSSVKELKAEGFINPRLVRREVGEWEEVK